jgi:hypothetical protein
MATSLANNPVIKTFVGIEKMILLDKGVAVVEMSLIMVAEAEAMVEINLMMVAAGAMVTVEISKTMVNMAAVMVVAAVMVAVAEAITTTTLQTMFDPEDGIERSIVPNCSSSRIFLQNVRERTVVPLPRLHMGRDVTIPSVCT